MESLQGQLLIASPRLVDPNFVRSVVLIVQHGEAGALGLVLNRPLEVSVRQAVEEAMEVEVECMIEESLHLGGPCQGALMVVHSNPALADLDIMPGVYFSVEKEKAEQLLAGLDGQCRFFVGHAGWTEGQLERELESGDWLTAPAEVDEVFDGSRKQWSRLVGRLTLGRWIDPEQIPDDPSVN